MSETKKPKIGRPVGAKNYNTLEADRLRVVLRFLVSVVRLELTDSEKIELIRRHLEATL